MQSFAQSRKKVLEEVIPATLSLPPSMDHINIYFINKRSHAKIPPPSPRKKAAKRQPVHQITAF